MTARRQPQRKRTARERLLEHVADASWATIEARGRMQPKWHRAITRRLLRAHERELASRAAAIGANATTADMHRAVYDAVKSAILGPPRKKGAR